MLGYESQNIEWCFKSRKYLPIMIIKLQETNIYKEKNWGLYIKYDSITLGSITSPKVLGKLRWATKLFDLNDTIKKQHMHIISKMFVFIWRKALIYKNWTWIVFTFCKIKTLIVIFISWAAHHWRKWFKASQAHTVWIHAIFSGCRVIMAVNIVLGLVLVVFIIVLFVMVVFVYSCRGSYFLISCCSRR